MTTSKTIESSRPWDEKRLEFKEAKVWAKVETILDEVFSKNIGPGKDARPSVGDVEIAIATALLWWRSDIDCVRAMDIAHHLTKWRDDANFLIALSYCPERLTNAEIAQGVISFLAYAAEHIAAAAVLAGQPIEDRFQVGALRGPGHRGVVDDRQLIEDRFKVGALRGRQKED